MTLRQEPLNKETIAKASAGGIPVIIFGAGVVAEALAAACIKKGIKAECFCDNNINKAKSIISGLQVIHPLDLKTRFNDALFLISAADIKDVISQLGDLGYSQWQPAGLLLRDFDLFRYKFSAPSDFVEYAVATALLCQDNYLDRHKLFLRSVDLIITERCSLKCRDCSNLMQYYRKPADADSVELMLSLKKFCALIDEANEFRVIGGEPFMNKGWHLIIERLINEPKIKKIVIYTNGTIIPSENQIGYLKSKKVLFIITDYGALSRKLGGLIAALRDNNIAYYRQKAGGWTDCAKIIKHNRNIEQDKEIFKACCAKNTFTLSQGKLYRCPFSANAGRLEAVPDFKGDYINILQQAGIGEDASCLKDKIRDFVLEKEFLGTCDYCNGRPFIAPEITPAIQVSRPLEYKIQNR